MNEQFERNLGIMTEIEIDRLQSSRIAIAGCGCIGGFSAELLARMGIGALNLADLDVFDVSNINRQCAANHQTVGQHKVEALTEHLFKINPNLRIEKVLEGISTKNAESFVAEADYVIDAIDYFSFADSVTLHRAARKHQKSVITAVALGFGTSVLCFDPNGVTLEQYIGISEDTPIEQLRGEVFPAAQYSSILPSYATAEKISGWIESRKIPTISVGQALGPGALVSKLILHLLGRQQPVYVPQSFQLQFEV
ncbi:ThiF family adenylyltransferase [Paenibacillus sp. sgz302251]|uniref:ThiF family adenylyltransferase n=1 Tax=Paenibacillus sp. sgz302251 TaxID=3414493 RepID=UPI003C7D5ED3